MATISQPEAVRLLAEVRARGITYLTGTVDQEITAAVARTPWSATELLEQLARSPDPRVRECAIALFLLHPEFATAIESARQHLEQIDVFAAGRLVTLALATIYLQRKWFPRLALALGHTSQLPEAIVAPYWRARQLPPPWQCCGERGLLALQAWERQHANPIPGFPTNFISGWQDQLNHLIIQEWMQRTYSGQIAYPPDILTLPEYPDSEPPIERTNDEERVSMSLRRNVNQSDIERFLQELGRMAHTSGRIYLAGGAALVHSQLRGAGATTADIDLKLDVADEHEVETAIRQLKTRLDINIELASPADFIPLPAAWQSMSHYVGRYGSLDVFYFDFYTLALAKIERATSRDLLDVELLASQGLIQRDQLEAAFQEILPQLGSGPYFPIDPVQFSQQFTAIVQHIWGQHP